jgi:thiol-disulfide isomerase/thioredoxin
MSCKMPFPGSRTRARAIVVTAALLLSMAAGCGGDSDEGEPGVASPAGPGPEALEARRGDVPRPRPEDAPPEIDALYEQASTLLGGGPRAFRERIEDLRGHPVVVNKWASWCPPCRSEFPFFASQAARRPDVAFIGVDSNDNDEDASEFLEEFPVPFPSYRDPDLKVAEVFHGVAAFPTTAYYDSDGELAYVKQGGYSSEEKLAEDIERYAK